MICCYLPGPRAAMNEGKRTLDGIAMRPMQPVPALEYFIRRNRSEVSNLKFIGSRDLPDLAQAFHVNMAANQKGLGESDLLPQRKSGRRGILRRLLLSGRPGRSRTGVYVVSIAFTPVGAIEDAARNVLAAIPKSF